MNKKTFGRICLPMIALLFLSAACSPSTPLDKETATAAFVEWLASSGVPTDPDTPMAGLCLGEVAKGSLIGSSAPFSEGEAMGLVSSRGSKAITEAGWLFYLDEEPGAFYGHPGRILVVGSRGKILHSASTMGWPTVNGICPTALNSVTSKDFHGAIVWNPWKITKPIQGIRDWVIPRLFPRIKGAVVVNGLVSGDALYSDVVSMHAQVLSDMQAMFPEDNVRSVTSASVVANPAGRIRDAVADLVINNKVNNITLYMIAHGSTDSIGVGGYSYNVGNLRSLISDYPSVRFCVLLETCHAGSWLDNFNGTLAGYPRLDNLGLFTASTSGDKNAYPDWDSAVTNTGITISDFDTSDAFIEWSSDFLKQLAVWSGGEHFTEVSNYASANAIETEWALFYFCFWKVKGSPAVPPTLGFAADSTTYTMAERSGVAQQAPQVFQRWTVVYPSSSMRDKR